MKIHLNEMVFYGYHGVHDEERKLGQRFIVSASLHTNSALDAGIRNLEDTVDYTRVYADIKEIMESRQFQLLECCANTIADRLLADYPLIESLSICIQKPSVPIQGSLKSVEVEVFRQR
ncbi:MAG: dihydroneopterin aldolase [Candidatus Cloacimonadales bacterium]|nr:dihydroneopterin aldolase [Candidatus Cloacimonadota bacterium]MDY0381669.1 dihydroneopterin aldolase [Candidatus Cloacimonadaceae bacterium]MCB5256431.1 dihydroneopterin aldolase [Candidatus Cloacimonadota bacterium]MCB5263203.1 dihydroneopterin aldolase [Candidatus Cloacimonadota bacterium]MCB5277429.1 dihydroneopterin aldolase [Candidatus Cloacimonadota bacterium]